jgi:hypothetical protein
MSGLQPKTQDKSNTEQENVWQHNAGGGNWNFDVNRDLSADGAGAAMRGVADTLCGEMRAPIRSLKRTCQMPAYQA